MGHLFYLRDYYAGALPFGIRYVLAEAAERSGFFCARNFW
jgi:hypothetical protein